MKFRKELPDAIKLADLIDERVYCDVIAHGKFSRRTFIKGLGAGAAVTLGVMAVGPKAFAAGTKFSGVISIVHFNDTHGTIGQSEKAIGYPKIGGLIDQIRAKNPNTMVFDAGDSFNSSAFAAFDKGISIANVLNTMGVSALSAGNVDFFLGKEHLLNIVNTANFPVLGGNILDESDQPILKGSAILELPNGMKVGMVSVTSEAAAKGMPFTYVDPIAVTDKLVKEIRPQVDLVVALLHLGDSAKDTYNSLRIANEVPGIDVIIDGHSHSVLKEGRMENGILIAQAGSMSEYVGVVDLTLESGKVVDAKARLMDRQTMDSMPEKAETAAALAALYAASDRVFSEVVGKTEVELVATRNVIRTEETNLGNMFTDAMREKTGADLAFAHAGPIGGNIKPGDVTMKDIFVIARVNSLIYLQEAKGADILAGLNARLQSYPEPSGFFLQASGISFKFDPSLPKDRAFDVKIGGQPLDLNKTYKIALLDALLEFPGFDKTKTIGTFGYTEDVILDYVRKHSPLNPKVEGRFSTGTKA